MRVISRAIVCAVFAIVAIAFGIGPAASAYPDRPIRLLIGFPPGGSSDAVARIVQSGLEKELGQAIVIENRPGAGGAIALERIAKSDPDGYTIGLGGAGSLVANLSAQALPYDPRKDLIPVTGLASSPFILVAANSYRGRSLRDFIAMAKEPGQTATIGHGGNGTLMHLTAEMLNQSAGTKIGLVPYRGTAPVVNDLLGGHVAFGIADPPAALAAIEGKTIWPIAISSTARFPLMPDIPTFAESGLPGFESTGWFGIVASGGTPADVIAKINAAFVKVLKDPEVTRQIRALGSEPMPMTPAEFSAFIDKESNKWDAVVKAATQKPN
jgi:tripartite-type tricarboxylate transporter receptor subunit TctC